MQAEQRLVVHGHRQLGAERAGCSEPKPDDKQTKAVEHARQLDTL